MTCSIDGCERSAVNKRGWCSAHYERWKKYGDPTGGSTYKGEAAAFVLYALGYTSDDCLLWPYSTNHQGYALLNLDGRPQLVSRLICEAANGAPQLPESDAAHSCGNGNLGCVSQNHLSWKTRRDNVADAVKHGTHPHGEAHGQAKLSEADVLKIIAMQGSATHDEIAAMYGVAGSTITRIFIGTTWSWLTGIGRSEVAA
jgi:hypothetical protein